MKRFWILSKIPFLLIVLSPMSSSTQSTQENTMSCNVGLLNSPLSISHHDLMHADSIVDLHKYYKPKWVEKFITVDVNTQLNGKDIVTSSQSDLLTQAQKDAMEDADEGSTINVNMRYIPNNTLSQNEEQSFGFEFVVQPIKHAQYPGGNTSMLEYLNANALNKLNEDITGYDLYAVNFTIDEKGKARNVEVFTDAYQPSHDTQIEKVMVDAICNMPAWTPAEYKSGHKTSQKFVFTMGNQKSCVINLVNLLQE